MVGWSEMVTLVWRAPNNTPFVRTFASSHLNCNHRYRESVPHDGFPTCQCGPGPQALARFQREVEVRQAQLPHART